MKITFNISTTGDWCVAVSDNGTVIYRGHETPGILLEDILKVLDVGSESVYYDNLEQYEEDWE